MTAQGETPFVFISHASAELEEARKIAAELRAHGIATWLAKDNSDPGRDYSIQLEEAIDRCAAFVVLLSEAANRSPFVRAETELAFASHEVFPVRIEDVQPAAGLGLFLRIKHWTDAFGPERDANLARLAKTVRHVVGLPDTDDTPPPPPPPVKKQKGENGEIQRLMDDTDGKGDAKPLSDDEAIRAFIGERAPHFLEAWRRMDEGKTQVSFNFPAFALPGVWMLYRKLTGPGLAAVGAIVVLVFLVLIGTVRKAQGLASLMGLALLALAIAVGIFGNFLYRRHVRAQTALLNKPGEDEQVVRDRLSMQGGTSPSAAVAAALGLAFWTSFLSSVLPECCAPDPEPVPGPSDGGSGGPSTDSSGGSSGPSIVVPPDPATSSAPAYTVCLHNSTLDSVSLKVDPDKIYEKIIHLDPGENEILVFPGEVSYEVSFDADLSSATSEVTKTIRNSIANDQTSCGLTYNFEANLGFLTLN